MRTIGKTQDPWAQALYANIPERAAGRTILLSGSGPHICATFFFWLARFRVLWLGSRQSYGPLTKRCIKLFSHFSHAILAPNQAIETQYLKAGISDKKISLIYPPCTPEAIDARKGDPVFTISCDGETGIAHGLGIIMRAVRDSRDILGTIRLVIGGAIPERNRIEWLAQELGIKDSLKLVPAAGYGWVAASDVFLFMRNNGASAPLAVMHALACGKPIIANDAPGHREFVVHHKNGILLKDANSDMLSQELISLARKPEWLAELGSESERFAEERFNPDAVQKKIEALIP